VTDPVSPRAVLADNRGWLHGLGRSRAIYQQLPERVRNTIRDQQDASEILIGWVQLGVVSLFGPLYSLAPKTFTQEAEFAPVPWVPCPHPDTAGGVAVPPDAAMAALRLGGGRHGASVCLDL